MILGGPGFFRLAFGHLLDALCAIGVFTFDRVTDWWATIENADAHGHFTGGASAFVVSGTVR